MLRRLIAPLVVVLVAVLSAQTSQAAAWESGSDLDYQLGGARAVPDKVGVVVRDRRAKPTPTAEDRYDICYVNAFQTQPDEQALWRARQGLVLKRKGRPVVDGAWNEWLLDLRTPAKRQRLAAIVGRWVDGCARAGFEAVEFDNLDSYTRSRGLMKRRHATAYARLLTAHAHAVGLHAAQKNLAGFDGRKVGYDFAIAEECGRYRECASYTRYYGEKVLAVEYRRADFDWTCARHGDDIPVVLTHLALQPTGLRTWC